MRSYNIAYFLSMKSEHLGGADHTLFMQALLMNSFHQVMVVLPCGEDGRINIQFQRRCQEAGLEYVVLSYDASTKLRSVNLADYRADVKAIEEFVLKKRIEILHSVQINIAVEYVSRKYHIPHVMNIYSLEDWEWQLPFLDIFPRYVSCDSEFYLKKWMNYLKCKGKCVRVFDEAALGTRVVRKGETIVIGAAGTITSYKNQLEIIKAVEIEREKGRDIRLLLAGRDDQLYAGICKDYIEGHQLQNIVTMLGFVENMKSFFEKIDVFICGSRRESFPASIVEAISCNIPIISTPVAGVPEILIDRKNAYLANSYSAEGLAEAIESYDRDRREGRLAYVLSKEAETYQKNFSAAAVKHQMEEMYLDLLDVKTESIHKSEWDDIEAKLLPMTGYKEVEGLEQEDRKRFFSRLLYLYQIKKYINAEQCYIWGAGKWGRITKILVRCVKSEMEIRAFVDSKKTGFLDEIRIIQKEAMALDKGTIVFVAFSDGQQEAVDYLKNHQMKMLKNIFVVV